MRVPATAVVPGTGRRPGEGPQAPTAPRDRLNAAITISCAVVKLNLGSGSVVSLGRPIVNRDLVQHR